MPHKKIDIISYYYGKSDSDLSYEMRVGYRAFTEDEFINATADGAERQALVDNNL